MENTYTINGSSDPRSPLKPHEYVIIKLEMTAADEAWIQNQSAQVSGDNPKNAKVHLKVGDVDLALLKRMIVGWNLTKTGDDDKQHPIPYSEKAVEELPRRLFKFIKAVINDLNPDNEDFSDFLPSAGAR